MGSGDIYDGLYSVGYHSAPPPRRSSFLSPTFSFGAGTAFVVGGGGFFFGGAEASPEEDEEEEPRCSDTVSESHSTPFIFRVVALLPLALVRRGGGGLGLEGGGGGCLPPTSPPSPPLPPDLPSPAKSSQRDIPKTLAYTCN